MDMHAHTRALWISFWGNASTGQARKPPLSLETIKADSRETPKMRAKNIVAFLDYMLKQKTENETNSCKN